MSIFNEDDLKRKFLKFMKERFKVEGAYCRVYDWNKFIVNEFKKEEIELATRFTQELINRKYLVVVNKNNEDFIAITGYGFKKIKSCTIEVDL